MAQRPIILLFPGQGSQYVGMGIENYNQELKEIIHNTYRQMDVVLGDSLSQICLSGPNDSLKLTQNAQPAIVAHSVALFKYLNRFLNIKKLSPSMALGHSVGEYSALVCTGSLEFDQAIKAVRLRGHYMQEATPVGVGTMIAILMAPKELVESACREVSSSDEFVSVANYNSPGQIVISGHKSACEKVLSWLKNHPEAGAFRSIPLQVSAPFHCELMKPAEIKLAKHLDTLKFKSPVFPYIANVDAREYNAQTAPEKIKGNLTKQICGSVLWEQSIQKLPPDSICIEVGPGKVLKGLMKKIRPELFTFAMEDDPNFNSLNEVLI